MEVRIYPNPSSGKLFVCGTEDGTKLTVFNRDGEEVHCSSLLNAHSMIDLSAQPEGVYFIELRLDEEVSRRKIVLLR